MPVPSAISELSQTAGSNFPTGSESPITADNYLRTYASFIALLRDGKGFTNPATLASASTTDIGGQNSMFVEVSGTTTITSLGTNYNGPRYVRFTGALTLTYNATTLNIFGGVSVTTSAGYMVIAMPNQALNGWNVFPIGGSGGTVAGGVIYENSLTISDNYTLTTGKNGHAVGPITISSGKSLTIPSGARFVVL